jgi:hypothetical protein
MMYDLNLKMQDMGLAVINAWVTVTPMLYLYNLIDNTASVPQVDWPDLDEFLKLHNENSIFIGGRPKDLEETYKKLHLSRCIRCKAS